MTNNHQHIAQLLLKRLKGDLTPDEETVLNNWLNSPERSASFVADMQNEPMILQWVQNELSEKSRSEDYLLARIKAEIGFRSPEAVVHRIHFLKTAWFRYAAILLLVAGTAATFYLNREVTQDTTQRSTANQPSDIPPGGNNATLTLADGSTIVLDTAENGSLAQQGGIRVIKLDGGKLAYQGVGDGEVLYNSISTPKGGQYQVELPDGSKVWLNAASSVRFPTSFSDERIIEITGESYLEIAADRSRPFLVKTGNRVIQVLGTSFNVNAYTEEQAVKVSLLEGSIKIGQLVLKPGEALMGDKIISTDLQQDIAWKNGIFDFRGQGLREVMRQLERWYDIEVVYERGTPDVRFGGKLSKGVSLTGILKGLQESGVHCVLEGRRMIVKP